MASCSGLSYSNHVGEFREEALLSLSLSVLLTMEAVAFHEHSWGVPRSCKCKGGEAPRLLLPLSGFREAPSPRGKA